MIGRAWNRGRDYSRTWGGTRQTELKEVFHSHVVRKWMGNSRKVANKHYLQVTEDHMKRAAQNPAQYTSVSACTRPQDFPENPENTCLQGGVRVFRHLGSHLRAWRDGKTGPPLDSIVRDGEIAIVHCGASLTAQRRLA